MHAYESCNKKEWNDDQHFVPDYTIPSATMTSSVYSLVLTQLHLVVSHPPHTDNEEEQRPVIYKENPKVLSIKSEQSHHTYNLRRCRLRSTSDLNLGLSSCSPLPMLLYFDNRMRRRRKLRGLLSSQSFSLSRRSMLEGSYEQVGRERWMVFWE